MSIERIVYTAAEAAEAIKTDPQAVYRKLEQGEIPAYREGRLWKVPISLLMAYVENKAIAEAKERRKLHENV